MQNTDYQAITESIETSKELYLKFVHQYADQFEGKREKMHALVFENSVKSSLNKNVERFFELINDLDSVDVLDSQILVKDLKDRFEMFIEPTFVLDFWLSVKGEIVKFQIIKTYSNKKRNHFRVSKRTVKSIKKFA